METILEVKDLTKKFGQLKAVDALSFSIEKGNVYGILGPNGSGKSTTLGILLNVVNRTSGNFTWFSGKVPNQAALKHVGAIIEHPNFYPYMTAVQNLKLVAKIKKCSTAKIEEKLDIVGMREWKNTQFKRYSLGMKQRLAIASALLNDPEILILDEPTNGLDPQGIHEIRQIIRDIAEGGTTILLASHLLDEVEKVCSHCLIIRKGQKLYAGPVDEVNSNFGYFELQSPNHRELLKILEQHKGIEKVKTGENNLVKAFLNEDFTAESLNRELAEKEIFLSHLIKRKETLEEQFLNLTKQS